MKTTAKDADNNPITFVAQKRFAVLFDLSVVLLRKLTRVFVQVENGREDFSK